MIAASTTHSSPRWVFSKSLLVLLSCLLVTISSARASGDDHDHVQCENLARSHGWTIDCNNVTLVNDAMAYLNSNIADCQKTGPAHECEEQYWIMQMHHDHCPHDALDETIETGIHDFEQYYDDCEISRQYDSSLEDCPAVSCPNVLTDLANANETLTSNNCGTDCSSATCKDTFQRVLMAHDTCEENQLPTNLEVGLHSFEHSCEANLCNSVSSPASSSKMFSWKLSFAVAGSALFLLL